MLTSSLFLLQQARKEHYAVPAFNVNNLEILQSVMQAAEEEQSPIILQTTEGSIAYAGMEYLVAMVRVAAQAEIPVVLHLDHGKDVRILKRAIAGGYTSVMFDGSLLSYQENVRKTQQIVAWARARDVSVEAELGAIRGQEDRVSVADSEEHLTDPDQAAAFVEETGCDSLAVAVGTVHGAYKFKGETHLDLERLVRIARLVALPLVLHGASGVQEDVVALAERYGAKIGHARGVLDKDVKKSIALGVAKVNIDTDLRLAFMAGVREALGESVKVFDPRELMRPAKTLMTEVARQKIHLFGSAQKA